MTRTKPKKRSVERGSDPDRLAWIRLQPCCACNAPPPSHAHHFIGKFKGMSLKAPDSEAMPLCAQDHKNLHEKLGMFRVMNKACLRSWQAAKVAHYQLLYGRFLTLKLSETLRAAKLSREARMKLNSDED